MAAYDQLLERMLRHGVVEYMASMIEVGIEPRRNHLSPFPQQTLKTEDNTDYARCSWNTEWIEYAEWQLETPLPELNETVPSLAVPTRAKPLISISFATPVPEVCPRMSYPLTICYGGGIDSTIALFWAFNHGYQPSDILLLHVNYGVPYAEKEKQHFHYFVEHTGVHGLQLDVNLTVKLTEQTMPKGYIVPGRNGLFAALGAIFSNEVWIVANYRRIDDEPGAALDKGRRFYGEMSSMLTRAFGRQIRVMSPYLHLTKAQTMAWFWRSHQFHQEVTASEYLSLHTTTCYHPTLQRCGACYACFKLAGALHKVGWVDGNWRFDTPVEEGPNFYSYIQRERRKGRVLPSLWEAKYQEWEQAEGRRLAMAGVMTR